MTKRAAIVPLVCLLLGAGPLGAQSIFSSAGIGLPVEGLDGRARALGSFGIGLQGPMLSPTDPAASARFPLPSGVIVAQPSWVDLTEQGSPDHRYFQGTRFPLLGLAYPAFQGVVTVYLTSVFDQGFDGERPVNVVLGGVTVPATDRFTQDGSVSQLAVGYARRLDARTAVGISLARYSGRVDRNLTRDYGTSTGIGRVEPYVSAGSWRYSGEAVTGGVATDLFGSVRIAASATWSSDLRADATSGTEGSDRTYSVPLQLRLGASSVLTPGLTVSASAVRADWSSTGANIGAGSSAGTVLGFGAGIELSRARLLGREAPLRFGYRRVGLPFAIGTEDAHERVFAGGLALILNQSNGVVLATVDLGVENGKRSGGTFTEDFWRGTVSLRLAGF